MIRHFKNRTFFFISLVVLTQSLGLSYGDEKPKYGPKDHPIATPLSQSNEYFRDPKHPAPDFWALISNYIPQTQGSSCSAASLAMVLNAARTTLPRFADTANITEEDLFNKIKTGRWKDQKSKGAFGRYDNSLKEFADITEEALEVYGFPNGSVKVVHIADTSTETKKSVIQMFKDKKPTDFVITNFNQQAYTNDADVGHYAPVGAYDSDKQRVLILDPDRGTTHLPGYYEPYWVSIDSFIKGMDTKDRGSKGFRGYLYIKTQ